MNRILIITLVLFASQSIFSQNLKWGLSIGNSLNNTAIKSDYSIEDNIYDNSNILGGVGVNFGGHTNLKLSEHWVLFSNLEYFRTHQACKPFVMSDESMENIYSLDKTIVNNGIQLSSLTGYRIKRFIFAGGVYINTLLSSTTVIHDDLINEYHVPGGYTGNNLKRMKNSYYSPINLGMSLMTVVNFNAVSINLKYNHGLTDKVSSSDNLVREYDRSVILGIWIYFN